MYLNRIHLLIISLCISYLGNAQLEIAGKISDKETNQPLVGANVYITQSSEGTLSDSAGIFFLQADEPVQSLTVSYLGYETAIIKNPSANIQVKLTPARTELDKIIVKGVYTKPVKRTSDAIYTGSALTEKGIKLMGTSANSSVFNAMDLLPGVNVEGNDAFGLSDKSVRIRCVKNSFSGMTIDGFPNYGIMPIGARDDIYDMENLHQIALYKGATPSDLGAATGSKGGVIELQFNRPLENFSMQLNQSLGTNYYSRTFGRIDFGKIKTNTSAFVSYSFTRADKWKGEGTLGPRNNMAIGITQPISSKIELEIFANYNQVNRHDFKPLTYDEASRIKETYKYGFNSTLSGNPADDMYYYDYNGGNFINRDLMSALSFQLSEMNKFVIKYYISSEDADFEEGVNNGPNYFVFNRKRDINRMGVIPEFSGKVSELKYALGYWYESCQNNANVYSSMLTAEGLQPQGYTYFTVNNNNGQVHSPYMKIAFTNRIFNLQAGIKYFYYMDPESERYTSLTPTELSGMPDPDLHTDEMGHSAFLPSAGLGIILNKKFEAYINYGKNYMRPYMYSPIISLYVKNQQVFTDNSMTLQDVFDLWEMETSDNFDLGLRYRSRKVIVSPSLFYARHHNVLASMYDPIIELDYYQNVGELSAFGAEIECYIFPIKKLMLYVNPTYSMMRYEEELTRSAQDLGIKGNQSPACPRVVLKTGGVYTVKNMDMAARIKYIGSRYGDATNTEEIDGYTLVDASVHYYIKNQWKMKELALGIELKNLLNTKYIGTIDVSDDSVQGSASYFAGSPFTGIVSLGVKF